MADNVLLFVDDEPNILSGLKRMLRSMRKDTDFHFAEGGKAALKILETQPIQVLITDMRMPGMDGAQLLAIVQEKYPHVIRIMLSGQADDESVLRTVGVVHQFISKPSDPETLKKILDRACALQKLMVNAELKAIVSRLGSLPSLPSTYKQLQDTLKNPESSIADIAHIIEQDMAMSAKVLQLVNSAFFGLFKTINSASYAVNLLGLDTIRALVLAVGVFSEIKVDSHKSFSIKELWAHSVATAAFAKKIAATECDCKETIDNSFVAGMVHDIGKLVLFSYMQDQYLEVVETAEANEIPLSVAEQQLLSSNHSDVGGYLLGLWGLPGQVIEAITFHHRLETYPNASFSPAIAVHAADVIYYKLHPERVIGTAPELIESYLKAGGLEDRLNKWTELCQELVE